MTCWKQRKYIRGEGGCKAGLEAIPGTYILLELFVKLVSNFIFVREKSGIFKYITLRPFFFLYATLQ